MSAVEASDGGHPLGTEVTRLLQVAMVVFVWTIGIGILNGTDVVDFDRKVLLSHVHAGTLGWITTSVFAASVWLFGSTASAGQVRVARALTWVSIVVLPVFSLTFAFTYDDPRAVLGTVALLANLPPGQTLLTSAAGLPPRAAPDRVLRVDQATITADG